MWKKEDNDAKLLKTSQSVREDTALEKVPETDEEEVSLQSFWGSQDPLNLRRIGSFTALCSEIIPFVSPLFLPRFQWLSLSNGIILG